jgi:hypothetical protein
LSEKANGSGIFEKSLSVGNYKKPVRTPTGKVGIKGTDATDFAIQENAN